jgi:RimJ/RimL family protein N-acetyltransferase
MVPLGKKATDWLRTLDDTPHRSIALRHASLHDRPGLWGDDSEHPSSIVWLRDGDDGGREAFAAGLPQPALRWLARRSEGRPIALLAPPSWERSVRSMGGQVEVGIVQTWRGLERSNETSSRIESRQLTLKDEANFEAIAPSWALRSWGDFPTLIEHGVAFGVPTAGGVAALAWTYESDRDHDKIGIATLPRYRRLGLGRSVGSTLIDSIVLDRRKVPVWVTTPANAASIALARSLGFSTAINETLLHWTPRRV